MLLPKDPNDDKDVILEVRAAAGGEEAALFAGELLRMYMRYAEKRGWKYDFVSSNETGIGGYKEAVMEIHGQGAYSALKFESGVHRVQRVPVTEVQRAAADQHRDRHRHARGRGRRDRDPRQGHQAPAHT